MLKKATDLMSANVNIIVVSNKFNHNEKFFTRFTGYQKVEIVRSLHILLP